MKKTLMRVGMILGATIMGAVYGMTFGLTGLSTSAIVAIVAVFGAAAELSSRKKDKGAIYLK